MDTGCSCMVREFKLLFGVWVVWLFASFLERASCAARMRRKLNVNRGAVVLLCPVEIHARLLEEMAGGAVGHGGRACRQKRRVVMMLVTGRRER
jgi:hypothetical protein